MTSNNSNKSKRLSTDPKAVARREETKKKRRSEAAKKGAATRMKNNGGVAFVTKPKAKAKGTPDSSQPLELMGVTKAPDMNMAAPAGAQGSGSGDLYVDQLGISRLRGYDADRPREVPIQFEVPKRSALDVALAVLLVAVMGFGFYIFMFVMITGRWPFVDYT